VAISSGALHTTIWLPSAKPVKSHEKELAPRICRRPTYARR
jgi:hypothetical protein